MVLLVKVVSKDCEEPSQNVTQEWINISQFSWDKANSNPAAFLG